MRWKLCGDSSRAASWRGIIAGVATAVVAAIGVIDPPAPVVVPAVVVVGGVIVRVRVAAAAGVAGAAAAR
jgi:hypothetical protein